MITVFHARLFCRFIERNFTERIKASIFLEAVLAIEIILKPQSNLEENGISSILSDDFFSKTDLSILPSIGPVFLDRSSKQVEFSQLWKQQIISCPSSQCLKDQIQDKQPTLVVATDKMPDGRLQITLSARSL